MNPTELAKEKITFIYKHHSTDVGSQHHAGISAFARADN